MMKACTLALFGAISLVSTALILQLVTLPATASSSSTPTESGGWVKVDQDRPPSARAGHAAVYDPDTKRVILFGGGDLRHSGEGRPRNDTWAWDGKQWSRLTPPRSPTARFGHAMAYDARRKVIVMFGGANAKGQLLRDLWEFDGRTWTQANTRLAPPPRADHAMAADTFNQRITLFGGRTAAGAADDMWQWDGRLWRPQRIKGTPDARYGHAMVYDPSDRRIILFGGANGGFPAMHDTWRWDGSAWEEVETETHPPAGRGHAMAFDNANNRVVLFGGYLVDQQARGFQRTWVFDGSDWRKITDPLGPADRAGCSLIYDTDSKQLMLFGGIGRRALFDDTWTRP